MDVKANIARLATRIAEELGQAAAEARRETAERLNQASRRLRRCGVEEEVYAALAESAAGFSLRPAVLRIGDGVARLPLPGGAETIISLQEARAIAAAASSADPVVALCVPGETPAPLAAALGVAASQKIWIQPVCRRGRTVAVLCAVPGETAALELLATMAGLVLESLEPASRAPELAPAGQAEEGPLAAAPGQDQPLHLRARRFARVRAAEIRLRKADAVLRGRLSRDLYTRLRMEIDAAREEYRLQFLARCPSLPDYLHRELVRTLAKDQTALLGADYPGPLTLR